MSNMKPQYHVTIVCRGIKRVLIGAMFLLLQEISDPIFVARNENKTPYLP